jgi:hypothetical protein
MEAQSRETSKAGQMFKILSSAQSCTVASGTPRSLRNNKTIFESFSLMQI